MKGLLNRLKTEPVFLFSLLEAIIGLLVVLQVLDEKVGGSIAGILAILAGAPKLGVVRNAVVPVVKVADTAEKIATEVVSRVDESVVGPVGDVPATAKVIVNDVLHEVLG